MYHHKRRSLTREFPLVWEGGSKAKLFHSIDVFEPFPFSNSIASQQISWLRYVTITTREMNGRVADLSIDVGLVFVVSFSFTRVIL